LDTEQSEPAATTVDPCVASRCDPANGLAIFSRETGVTTSLTAGCGGSWANMWDGPLSEQNGILLPACAGDPRRFTLTLQPPYRVLRYYME